MSNVSKKALKERNFRKREKDRKRFEKPLRVFLEYKYKTIYEEYEQLFNLMVTNHPNKRNLVSTKTFKNWLQVNPKASDILSVAVVETLGEIDEQPGVANEQLAMNDEANEQPGVANEQLAMNDEANEQLDVANESSYVPLDYDHFHARRVELARRVDAAWILSYKSSSVFSLSTQVPPVFPYPTQYMTNKNTE